MSQQDQAKQKPSPKAAKAKQQVWVVFRTVVIAAVLGIFAGAIGALLAFNYLSDYLASIMSPSSVLTVSPVARVVSPGSLESAIELAEEKVVPAMVTFYKAKSGTEPEDSIYYENDILGYGVVFTSDGWLIAPDSVLENIRNFDVRVGIGRRLYEIEKSLVDEVTGAEFIKVSAENLPVVQLADEDYIASGDRLVVVWEENYEAVNLINKEYNPLSETNYLESSEVVDSRLLLTSGDAEGGVIINYSGEVVGMIWGESADGTLGLGLELLRPLMKSLLKEGSFVRPYLGVNYIDLGRMRGLDEETTQGRSEGALVWSGADDEPPAVAEGSPAEEAEMQKGDVIISVNGQTLNSHGTLSRMLLDFNPGDRLNLEILRAGESMSINLTLSALNEV